MVPMSVGRSNNMEAMNSPSVGDLLHKKRGKCAGGKKKFGKVSRGKCKGYYRKQRKTRKKK